MESEQPLGPVRQLGYVVRDLDEALRTWTQALEVGPFFRIDRLPLRQYMLRGAPSSPQLSGALGVSGDLQIELLAVHGDAPSMWREFLDAGHEGLHHVAYWTRDFDRHLARLTGRGMVVGHEGRSGPSGRFAYLTPAGGDLVLELSEVDELKAAVFATVAGAARDWDGRDPVRPLDQLLEDRP